MSEYADFIKMLREGDWYEGDVNYDDLLKAANIIEELEQQLAELRESNKEMHWHGKVCIIGVPADSLDKIEALLQEGGE